jgi:acyl carrier protein
VDLKEEVLVKDKVRELILQGIRDKGGSPVSDDESLFKSGAIDSLTMFKFIDWLESSFPIRIADHEMITDNFESINKIECFVTAKLNGE